MEQWEPVNKDMKRYSVEAWEPINIIVFATNRADAIARAQAGVGERANNHCGDTRIDNNARVLEY